MLPLKVFSHLLIAMFLLLSIVDLGVVRSDSSDDDDDDDDDNNNNNSVHLPANITELFADVYNNNSISLTLKARVTFYTTGVIDEIAPGVFLASKYSMGNSLWIVTPQDTIIVIDTTEAVEVATRIRTDMRQLAAIGNKPIRFIIYTIFHGDHTYGASALVNDPANGGKPPMIIGHKKILPQTDLFDNYRFIKLNRVHRVFGTFLPPTVIINAFTPLSLGQVQITQYYPNILLDMDEVGQTQDLVLEGVPMQFMYVPGYTEDQIVVWIPGSKVLACADHFYSLLPNIYTIRGEPARDALAWSKTTRLIRSYNAEVLAPSHMGPISGRDKVADILEKIADILQYIHDQTVRLLGKGLTADVVSRMIQLPSSLANEPLLPPYYGTVEGHSRSVADLYTGWFNGEAEDLLPVSKSELASFMLRDFGRKKLLKLARKAYESGEYRWALTLSSYVWRAEGKLKNDALYWRTQSLKRLADNMAGGQWRNYLYSTALIDWGFLTPAQLPLSVIASRPFYMGLRTIDDCFELMAMHVDPQKADGVNQTIELSLSGDPQLAANQVYRLRLRNSVLAAEKVSTSDVSQQGGERFTRVQTDNSSWRQILAGKLLLSQALQSNTVVITYNGTANLQDFLNKFDFVDQF